MKKNVLLVEDARDVQLLVRTAIGDKVNLTCVDTAKKAWDELHANHYSLMLLDVHLPDENGLEFCRRLRLEEAYSDLPVFLLTGVDDTQHKVAGFQSGADDYLTKPFDAQELEARVLRKLESRDKGEAKETIQIDGYRVDLIQHKVFQRQADGSEELLSLTPLEFRLLTLFLKNEGKIFPRQELLKMFWGDAVHVSRNTVDTHISSLRKKMGDDSGAIKSVFKKGYSFSRKKAAGSAKVAASATTEESPRADKIPSTH